MKKAITASAILSAALIAYAAMTGEYNTWLGYLAGEDASGDRTTVQGAGAGGGAEEMHRTELIGAASGVYGYWFQDSVGIGYRALRHSSYMTNVIAIGSHALEGVQGMGTMANVTWIGGHFVANPPNPDPTMGWSQVPGEFYITGDASKTNSLAPIWFDGTRLHLRGVSGTGSDLSFTNRWLLVDDVGGGFDVLVHTGDETWEGSDFTLTYETPAGSPETYWRLTRKNSDDAPEHDFAPTQDGNHDTNRLVFQGEYGTPHLTLIRNSRLVLRDEVPGIVSAIASGIATNVLSGIHYESIGDDTVYDAVADIIRALGGTVGN